MGMNQTYMFYEPSHPTLGYTSPTEYLDRVCCSLLGRLGAVHFKEAHLSESMRVIITPYFERAYIPSEFVGLYVV